MLTFKTSKLLRDAARIQSVWPTLEEFGCSGCDAVAPWNDSNLNIDKYSQSTTKSRNHRLKMNPCRGKYLLNCTRGINCVCLCPYSTISQHIPPFPSISQYWHGRRFTIAVRILTAYEAGTESHICWWRVESFFAADQINLNKDPSWYIYESMCIVCVCKRNILCIIMHLHYAFSLTYIYTYIYIHMYIYIYICIYI